MEKPEGYRKGDVLYRAEWYGSKERPVIVFNKWKVVRECPVMIEIAKHLGSAWLGTKKMDPMSHRKFAWSSMEEAEKHLWWRTLRHCQHELSRFSTAKRRLLHILEVCKEKKIDLPAWAKEEVEFLENAHWERRRSFDYDWG
jgi:hypothetical protein